MTSWRTRLVSPVTWIAVTVLGCAVLTACGGSAHSRSAAGGKPRSGGTLRIVADGGPEDNLDPVPSYILANYILEHAFTRQLLSYPTVNVTGTSGPSWARAITPVPDVAAAVPSKANGGISASGLVYTFHLRAGVYWNSSPPRQVTADDFVREYKAFCNPVSPVGNVGYFDSTIAGFSAYCDAENAHFLAKHAPAATPAAITAWQDSHVISGVTAPSAMTLRFTLTQPASDFDNIMAMPFDSARPASYDSYLPASAQLGRHLMSDGPYQISSWVPNKTIVMTRNPAWRQSADPIRHQYVSKIVVTMGTSSAQTALDDLQAGTQDLELDLSPPPDAIPGLLAGHSRQLHIWPASNSAYYVLFNFRSPDAGGAMSKLAVRQAVAYAIDKSDVGKILGGPSFNKIISTAIPPGNSGYSPYDPYATPGDAGAPGRCTTLLAKAGYPHGFSATYLYLNDSINAAVFQAIQASLAKCKITLTGKPENGSTYYVNIGNAPQNDKAGQWDMATGSWYPDWFGDNGRSIIQPLFQTDCVLNTVNGGCYSSPTVDSLITRALRAPTAAAAAPLWQQADQVAMHDVAIVPLIDQYSPQYASSRVDSAAGDGTANYSEAIDGPDITTIWLS